ncbi:MAG: branched-chain amino acid ABC transporter permease [Thermodesulfobacteriota bacterium]
MALLPCGIYFEDYRQDMAYLRTKPQWAALLLFLALLMVLPYLLSVKYLAMINLATMICIAVVGLQLTTGYAGQINLGQSAFMGMGAFVCGSLSINFHLPFWITIPAGGLGAAALGAVFGVPALRIKGFYLAMTTIAAQVIFPLLVMHLPNKWFGGAIGLNLEPARIGPLKFDTDISLYYFIMITAIVMIFFAFNLVRCRVGRAFVAIRDNDIAAEMTGINVFYYKTLAFAIGAGYAGVAGGLWAYYLRYVGADQFTLYFSVWYMGMLIVGGLGSVLGAIFGTFFIRALQEMVTALAPKLVEYLPMAGSAEVWFAGMNILLGGTIVLFLIFEPRGLYHRWVILKTSYRIWPFPYV